MTLTQFKSNAGIIISGASGSGKTQLVKEILEHLSLFEKQPEKIFYCYKHFKPIQKVNTPVSIEFIDGIPENFEELLCADFEKLFVFDDLHIECMRSRQISSLFCVGNRHSKATTILLTHNLFCKEREQRTISLNTQYYVLFRNIRDALSVKTFAKQLFPDALNFFMDAYKKATAKKFSYLLVDLHPSTDDSIRLRSNILSPSPSVWVPASKNF